MVCLYIHVRNFAHGKLNNQYKMAATHDFKVLEERTKWVLDSMREKFPDCPYTIWVWLWDDGTSCVECRYGQRISDVEVLVHKTTSPNPALMRYTSVVDIQSIGTS